MKVYELEDLIQSAWNTESDLQTVLKYMDDHLDLSKPQHIDNLCNLLIGVEAMHNARMNALWDGFVSVLRSNRDYGDVIRELSEKVKSQQKEIESFLKAKEADK